MNYRASWYLTHPWLFIGEKFDIVKAFIQRGKRGYADCDVWDLGHYLSSWLPNALRELSEGNSYPSSFDGWCHGMTAKKWQTILRKMAKGFESMDDVELKGWSKEDAKRRKQRELFSFWFWNLWS